MRIAIVGIGAVGGYFGGRLAQSHHEVIFIARGAALHAIRARGLRVQSAGGDFVAHPTVVTDAPDAVGVVDVVVVATKAWQVEAAAHAMQPMVGSHTMVVPLLNGVEAPLQLSDVLGADKVLGGFCRVLSRVAAAGQVVQGGTPPFVSFGEMTSGPPSERVQRLRAVFESVGVTAHTPDSIQAEMWQKLLFVASVGGVGAAARIPAGILRTLPETRALLQAAMHEVYDVAVARHVPMRDDAVAHALGLADALPDDATMSMQRDLMDGRPSELDAQNGAVVRLGRAVDTPAPTHEFLYRILLPSERQARGDISL